MEKLLNSLGIETFAQRRARINWAADAIVYSDAYKALLAKWSALVDRVNAKGGEAFLQHGVMPEETGATFTREEVEALIRLCHPDKHAGSEVANRLTTKLLSVRRSL